MLPKFIEPDEPKNAKALDIAIVGLPNAGKSTLVNRLMGKKISIVSPKVQTTRKQIQAVLTVGNTQLVRMPSQLEMLSFAFLCFVHFCLDGFSLQWISSWERVPNEPPSFPFRDLWTPQESYPLPRRKSEPSCSLPLLLRLD